MNISVRSSYVRLSSIVLLLLTAILAMPRVSAAQALPSGWATRDIGSPSVAGAATYTNSRFTVTGAGSDVWGTSDQFRFAYTQLTGDGVVVARVDSLQQAHVWSKAGVMIRESLTAGSKNAYTLASSAKGLAFQWRASTSGTSASTIVSGAPPRWVRIQRAGSTFTSSVSSDGATWQVIGSSTITMAATTYVGLAVTSHSSSTKVNAVFSSVAVTASSTPTPNAPPSLTITAPAAGATVSGSVNVTGTASDDVQVSKVEVAVDGGAYTAATGTQSWSAAVNSTTLTNGAHTLSARATDSAGATTVRSVSITVSNTAANAAPTVNITAPAAGATVSGSVAVTGTASDDKGVTKVELSVDGGAYSAAAGTTAWSTTLNTALLSNGAHTLAARATDAGGLTAVRSISITVSNTTTAPTAAGAIPAGYPNRLAVGLFEDNGATWMRNSGARWDARYRYLVQGWVNNWGWGSPDGSFALSFMNESSSQGYLPVLQFYVMNGVSGYNESAFLATAQNATRMADYFSQWRILLQRARDYGRPVVIMVEADGFGFLQQQTGGNPNTYAAVAASGVPELAGLPNTVAGWGLAFLEMRAAVGASNVILAMDISGWATGKDIFHFSVTDPLGPEVDKAYNFLAPLGIGANQTGETWDLLANNPLDRDSDYYTTLGQNRWWDASNSASISSRSFNRFAEWLRLWNVKANKRWVLWQIPLGNSNHLNVYNNGGSREGYKDNRPEYFFGADGDAHRRKFAAAGVIGLFFGGGASGMSGYQNDTYTDGQLFMRSRAGAFVNAGGLGID